MVQIPRQCETQELEKKARYMAEEEEERLMPVRLITEKPASGPKPPPAPPLPAQWPQACFPPRTSRDETRASQLSRQLERCCFWTTMIFREAFKRDSENPFWRLPLVQENRIEIEDTQLHMAFT